MKLLMKLLQYPVNKTYQYFSNHKLRKRIKNKNFSIIAPNCIGGIIYNRLGMKFLSPTINLWMTEKDFLEFCINLKEYLSEDLVFVETEESYPVAKLGNVGLKEITIHFNHYKTEEDARKKWNQRKERINFDNLYIVTSDRMGMTYDDISAFKEISCKNKVLFSSKEYPELPYVYQVDRYKGKDSVGLYVVEKNPLTGITAIEEEFDFIEFLNGQYRD